MGTGTWGTTDFNPADKENWPPAQLRLKQKAPVGANELETTILDCNLKVENDGYFAHFAGATPFGHQAPRQVFRGYLIPSLASLPWRGG
jgi:hypothetical protein